ncbi:MAG TPA: hypothetical protein IGS37_15690 [Synechococcales cyanobacterium M55_K2018_004]|nr:hypothetical protein [Synechococcales cyanobacterium M55_K2018_004]
MTSIQPQPANLPPEQMLADGVRRWWAKLQCTTTELWQNLSDRNTGKIYRSAFHKTWELLQQIGTLLLLLLLSLLGLLIGAWLLGFHTGREFRKWLEADSPTPQKIFAKLLAVLLLPFQILTIWLDRALKQAFGWDLKLTQLLPPADPDLLPKELVGEDKSK